MTDPCSFNDEAIATFHPNHHYDAYSEGNNTVALYTEGSKS